MSATKISAPVIVALLAGLALTGAAQAQITSEQRAALRANCRSDFMSKCSGVTPGGKDALLCLQKNVDGLSPACKTAVSATMPPPTTQAAPAVPAAPAAPKPAQAAPAQPVPGVAAPAAVTPAPPAQPAAVSPPPKTQKATAPKKPMAPAAAKRAVAAPAPVVPPPAPLATEQQIKSIRFTCRHEFARLCPGVLTGGAEEVDCLRAQAAKLDFDCKISLDALGDAMPPPAGAAPPPAASAPKAPLVMTAVIGRSCLRDLIRHCRNVGVGGGRKIACLTAHADELTVPCRAAMKITTPLR